MSSSHQGMINKPILVVGLPKSGTTSIHEYFTCGGYKASHWRCRTHKELCGALIRRNVRLKRPPLDNIGDYDVYTQLDGDCYFPQIKALEEIHEHYPNSTFILNLRNIDAWMNSMRTFNAAYSGILPKYNKVTLCEISEKKSTDEQYRDYYNAQTDRIRDFIKKYPSHTLVEVQIDSNDAGVIMENNFGIDKSCWKHANKKQNELGNNGNRSTINNTGFSILACIILFFTLHLRKRGANRFHKRVNKY